MTKAMWGRMAGALALAVVSAGAGRAQENTVMVGGAAMYPSRDIIDNAMQSKDHTTLVAAVQAAGLVDTLKGQGPFTVFAPTDAAFAKLPAGTVATLLAPENKRMLTGVLTYHVVAGRFDADTLKTRAMAMDGSVELKTVQGATLWAVWRNNALWLKDGKGTTARITIPDVYQSNGVIHVIDTVVMAK